MTLDELINCFQQLKNLPWRETEYKKFDRIEKKLSRRPDLHACILLDSLVPGDSDIVECAEHDGFWISIKCEELASVITENQIRDLVRCAVFCDEGYLRLQL